MKSRHSLFVSFKYAFEGLSVAIKKGRNFRAQMVLGVLAIFFGFYLGLSSAEWLVIVIVISSVLILELINTALESIVDIVSPEVRSEAKVAKDMAAASVLVAAIASVVVGLIVFLPKVLLVI